VWIRTVGAWSRPPRLGDCETVLQLALACVRDDMLLAELDEASRTTIK
jgi:hypothetical protein